MLGTMIRAVGAAVTVFVLIAGMAWADEYETNAKRCSTGTIDFLLIPNERNVEYKYGCVSVAEQ